jgi:formate C-acetyltransferase
MDSYRDRIKRLRNHLVVKPSVSVERGKIWTDSYKETEGREPYFRQALALKQTLEKLTILIDDDELLVGRITEFWRGSMLLPEINIQFLETEMDDIATRPRCTFEPIPKDKQDVIWEMLEYWKQRNLHQMWQNKVPAEMLKYEYNGLLGGATFCDNGHYLTHVSADYERLVRIGLLGIRKEIEDEIAGLDLLVPEDFEKLQFLEAALISNKAAADFALRYARLAAEQAMLATDPRRKAELEEIARICAKVPVNPADTYYEAVQSIVFAWTVVNIEGQGNGLCFGRLDQLLYPFYQREKAAGTLTDEFAQILMSMLYIKANGVVNVYNRFTSNIFTGWPQTMNVNVGGIDKNGRDVVNELSYMFLDADLDVALTQNDIVVRVEKKTPSAFVIRAIEVAKALRGKVKFMSDETIIQQLLHDGYALDDARNYVITGCSTVNVPGRSLDTPGTLLNMPLLLEMTLNDGKRRHDGEQLGPKAGDPREFKSFEEIWEAFRRQCEYLFRIAVPLRSADRHMYGKYRPVLFHSCLFNGPLQKGVDMWAGGSFYARGSFSPSGTPNVADSFAAIKKVVFEDKAITMDELIDALDANFEGHDRTLKLLSDAPKYGNDINYVDDIMNEILMMCVDIITPIPYAGNAKSTVSPAALSANVSLGLDVSALPDGRLAFQPLAEGGVSPYQGRNVSGPIATYRSAARIDNVRLTNGSIFNMRFSPKDLDDRAKLKKFEQMLRTFLEEGGFFVQYNIVDTETLRAAQKNPEEYKDLLVRVATYSAYFVELGEDLQEDIISRLALQA